MKLRYGISKQVRKLHCKKRILTENHKMDLPEVSSLGMEKSSDIIIKVIIEKHPEWFPIGWCEDN